MRSFPSGGEAQFFWDIFGRILVKGLPEIAGKAPAADGYQKVNAGRKWKGEECRSTIKMPIKHLRA
jgi:hypothetical protein